VKNAGCEPGTTEDPMRRVFLITVAAAVLVSLLLPAEAGAIPAFARQHKLSCTTCHDPFPRLKPYGEDFAGNGFRLPEGESDRDYVQTGDPELSILRDFPLGVRMDAYVLYEQDNPRAEYDMQTPWGVKLLSGGGLSKNVGYYFYFYLSEHGEVAGVEDAYLHFNDLFGQPLDIMVGQFQTSDPLMKRELRMTYEDYLIYKQAIGESGMNLAYDRGFMFTYDVEKTATGLVAMVVNGNGIGESENGVYDHDDMKSLGARITQDVGEVAMLGGFYYYGEESLVSSAVKDGLKGAAADDPSMQYWDNEVTYWGVDAGVAVDRFALTAQFLMRDDCEPELGTKDAETQGVVAEFIFAPQYDRSRHYFTLLYNRVDSDLDEHDYESITGNVTYLMARNLRLNAEFTQVLGMGAEDRDFSRVSLGVNSGF
jgi:hypothetical protein